MTQAVSNSNTYNVHAAGVNGLELGEIPLVNSGILTRLLIRNRAKHFEDQLLVVVRDFVEGTVQASILRDRVRCLPTTSSKLVEIITRVDRSIECCEDRRRKLNTFGGEADGLWEVSVGE